MPHSQLNVELNASATQAHAHKRTLQANKKAITGTGTGTGTKERFSVNSVRRICVLSKILIAFSFFTLDAVCVDVVRLGLDALAA